MGSAAAGLHSLRPDWEQLETCGVDALLPVSGTTACLWDKAALLPALETEQVGPLLEDLAPQGLQTIMDRLRWVQSE